MAKLFRKKDGSAVVKSSNGKIVNNLPAPPSLSGVPTSPTSALGFSSVEKEAGSTDYAAILKSARVNSYASETARVVPVNNGNIPEVYDPELVYEKDDGLDEIAAINRNSPPKAYYDSFEWRESYLLQNSSEAYDIWGLKHYGDAAADAESRLTLQAVLTENVKNKLRNPAFQGDEASDATPYLLVSKDISDIAKTIIADKKNYTREEVNAAYKIVDNTPYKEDWDGEHLLNLKKLNPAIAEKKADGLRFTKEADIIFQTGERAIANRTDELNNIKNRQQSVIPNQKREVRRGGVGKTISWADQGADFVRLYASSHHRIPSASKELEDTRNRIVELNQEIKSSKYSLKTNNRKWRERFGQLDYDTVEKGEREKKELLNVQRRLEGKAKEINPGNDKFQYYSINLGEATPRNTRSK